MKNYAEHQSPVLFYKKSFYPTYKSRNVIIVKYLQKKYTGYEMWQVSPMAFDRNKFRP
jgi:hypothetical protein